MKLPKLISLFLICFLLFGLRPAPSKPVWVPLFNGKDLSGWDTYLGPEMNDQGKPVSSQPIGLNQDPKKVFSIVNDGGQNVIRISGNGWGAIITKEEYQNYHLQLQFKWGSLSWGQKKGRKKDSGLLYHSVGAYGADYGAWMRAQEFQIEEGNCGDYWGCAGGTADIPALRKSDSEYVYSKQANLITFSAKSKEGRHCIKGAVSAEHVSGEWNTLDLYCLGDTSIHVVNGKVMMILYHNSQIEAGTQTRLDGGRIQLQSEGAEIFYRSVKIQSIKELPTELTKQF